MSWDSIVSAMTSGVQDTASFAKGVGGGVADGASSLVSGVAALGKGALSAVQATGRAVVDSTYRDEKLAQATALANSVADYGGRLYDDPATRSQAYDQVQSAVGSIKDSYVQARDAAAQQGRLSEFYGGLVGRGGFEVAALLVPVTKLGALGKTGVAAEGVADLGKVAKVGEAMVAGKAGATAVDCSEVAATVAKILESSPVSTALADEILALPKGVRPNPVEYLPPQYVSEHLAQFEKGGSRFTLRSTLDEYGIAQSDGTSFLMTKAAADELLASTKGDVGALEKALGLPSGTLASDELIRIDIPDPRELGLRIPSGNEAGANALWLPGGKLRGGALEAVVDVGEIPSSRFVVTPIRP